MQTLPRDDRFDDEAGPDQEYRCDWPRCDESARIGTTCTKHFLADAATELRIMADADAVSPIARAALLLCSHYIRLDPQELFSDPDAVYDWEQALKGDLT
jgi:hypothetical protein